MTIDTSRLTRLVVLKERVAVVFLKTRLAVSHRTVRTVRLSLHARQHLLSH